MVAVALSWGFTLGAVGSQGGVDGKGGTWSENARGPGGGEALEKETRLAAERPVRGTAQWSSGDDKGRATPWHGSGVRGLGGTCSLVGQSRPGKEPLGFGGRQISRQWSSQREETEADHGCAGKGAPWRGVP